MKHPSHSAIENYSHARSWETACLRFGCIMNTFKLKVKQRNTEPGWAYERAWIQNCIDVFRKGKHNFFDSAWKSNSSGVFCSKKASQDSQPLRHLVKSSDPPELPASNKALTFNSWQLASSNPPSYVSCSVLNMLFKPFSLDFRSAGFWNECGWIWALSLQSSGHLVILPSLWWNCAALSYLCSSKLWPWPDIRNDWGRTWTPYPPAPGKSSK